MKDLQTLQDNSAPRRFRTVTAGCEIFENNPVFAPANRRPTLLKQGWEAYCHFMLKCYCPLTVTGREHLPEHPFLFCSNHCSHMDSVVLMASTGRSFDEFALVAAKDYFFHKHANRIQYLQRLMNLIPLDREPSQTSIKENIRLCRNFGAALLSIPKARAQATV